MPEISDVSSEFIEESKLCQTMPKSRKSGRHTKNEIETRRNEVYRLHFEYGYSARKISELMKINRNTINGDVAFWYSKAGKKQSIDPRFHVVKHIESLEIQKTRLREEIDKTKNFQERTSMERLLFDVDSKIIQIHFKLYESSSTVHGLATKWLNEWMKENNKDGRYITWANVVSLSVKAHDKVDKIIKEDENNCEKSYF